MKNTEDYEQKFRECMEQLAKTHERSKVFVDFMDYYIYNNSNSPERQKPHGYKTNEETLLQEAYKNYKKLMTQLIRKHGWYDYLGEYYEEYILAGHKASSKGQFYTPRQISQLLSDIVGYDTKQGEAYDPTCGSARNLLDYHYRNPGVRLVGEDLDESACKMAVLNFHIHNVNGIVNWIDALTREYNGVSWRIMGGQIYITDMEWIRATDRLTDAVSILLLPDEKLVEVLKKVVNSLPIREEKVPNTSRGLDEWIQKSL